MKLSSSQLFWIMFSIQAYNALNPALVKAKQDAWIAVMLGAVLPLAVCRSGGADFPSRPLLLLMVGRIRKRNVEAPR